jgi:hypothetical protein
MTSSVRWFRLIAALILVLVAALASASPAFAAESDCLAAGGTWSGVDADNGKCTYPSGSTTAVNNCISIHASYEETFVTNAKTDSRCFYTPSGTRIASDGGSDTAFTMPIKGPVKGSVEFFGGSCKVNCTVDTTLPLLAKELLDQSPLATVYVRVDGGAGTGSYRVCFSNPLGEGLNLYQFVGGGWSLVSHTHGNPICATASGDSAFYLH